MINPNYFEIYSQEIDELCALGLITEEAAYLRRQEIQEGLEDYYNSLDDREPYE